MKTFKQLQDEIINLSPMSTYGEINNLAAKKYAKQYLQEVATKLEPYDDDRNLLSQIPYRLMDEIDKQ